MASSGSITTGEKEGRSVTLAWTLPSQNIEKNTQITEYDDKLVRKYIDQIKIYDDKFVVCFKAKMEINILR